jgi:hypothetical protein
LVREREDPSIHTIVMTSREAICGPTVLWAFALGSAAAHRTPVPKLNTFPAFGLAISRVVASLTFTKQVRTHGPAPQPGPAR